MSSRSMLCSVVFASAVASVARAQAVLIGGLPANAPAPSLCQSVQMAGSPCGLLGQCAATNSGPGGCAWEGSFLWQGNFFGSQVIEKIDPATCAVVHSIPAPAPYIGGLAWDGATLWACAEQNGEIIQIEPVNGNVLNVIPAPGIVNTDPNSAGVAWDGQNLWHTDYTFAMIYKLDPSNGNVLASFPAPGAPADLEYVSGVLVVADYFTDRLDQVDATTGAVIGGCTTPGGHPWGVAVTPAGDTWNADTMASTVFEIDSNYSAIVTYCTSGTSTNGCLPAIASSGTPSASASSGFTVSVNNVPGQKQGILFYGISGRIAFQWGAGSTSFVCVKAPTQRMTAQNSGGTAGGCNGLLSQDWLAFIAANPTALGAPFAAGNVVNAQGWYRDPTAVKTTNLSDALEFPLQP